MQEAASWAGQVVYIQVALEITHKTAHCCRLRCFTVNKWSNVSESRVEIVLCLVTNYSHVKFYIELNVYLLCGECDGLSFTKSRGSIKV